MDKHIILLNGSSSAGKSTLARELQAIIEEKRNERYEIVSIDDFLKMTVDTHFMTASECANKIFDKIL